MATGQHDNLWAIGSAIIVGVVGWGLVKVPARWYVVLTMPVMCVFWGGFLLWVLGSTNHFVDVRLRNVTGFLFLFEFVLGPIFATFFGVTGLVRKMDTVKRTFIINQCLAWPYAAATLSFWGLLLYAAYKGA